MKFRRPINSPIYRAAVRQSFVARRALGRIIPDAVSARARAALGLMPLCMIDLDRLQLIREAPLDRLRDPRFLEVELLPALGLGGDAPEVYPDALKPFTGKGLRHWQYPSQFGPYLAHLAESGIRSYVEIGVQHGGTFAITVEYLQRFGALEAAYAIDLNRVPSLKQYARQNPIVRVLREDSASERFRTFVRRRGPFGLVFIDGDHSEAGCRRDFDNVAGHATMIAFHDISDGYYSDVRKVWQQVRQSEGTKFNFYEFVEQYAEVQARIARPCLGIGLAVAKS
jgi:hypothetical protein